MKSWDLIRLRRFLEWSAADVLAWRLTWSDNVIWWRQMTSAAVFRRVLSPLARDGDAKNLGGAWRRVRRRMTTRFSGQVDRWTTRPSWRRVWLRSSPGVENLRRRVWEFQEPLSARGGTCDCRWRSSFWVSFARGLGARLWCWFHQAKQGFAQIWRIKSRLRLSLLDFDTAQSHGGC